MNEANKLSMLVNAFKTVRDRETLEEVGFQLIKESAGMGIDRGQWVWDLIQTYPQEVVAVFGNNPFEVPAQLGDIWDMGNYHDVASGLTMSWQDWSEFFSTDVAIMIYNHMVNQQSAYRESEARAERLQSHINAQPWYIKDL